MRLLLFLKNVIPVPLPREMINIIRKILKGSAAFQEFYLDSNVAFATNSSRTIFKKLKESGIEHCLFLNRKLLAELSSLIKPGLDVTLDNEEIILKTKYSTKKIPLLSIKDQKELISLHGHIPQKFSSGIILNQVPDWQELVSDLKDLKNLINTDGLLITVSKEDIRISTPEGVFSSFLIILPLKTAAFFHNKSFTCNKEFLLSLKESTLLYLHEEKTPEGAWIILENEETITYIPLKKSNDYHTPYPTFDPLSFL